MRSIPPIKVYLERSNSTALAVRAHSTVSERDSQLVNIPLSTHPGKITSVTVCYRIITSRPRSTFISSLTLYSMTTPRPQITVLVDETDLWSTADSCYTSRHVYRETVDVDGSLWLGLTTVFGDANDVIVIGGIEISMDERSFPPAGR